ncbi:MAG TPA: hypothetical protein VJI46_05045 [Candidatus Nanoarchaeia archaeon]|nr:hypothetical protein [Candidatus Nanoarchaeia archaeon]
MRVIYQPPAMEKDGQYSFPNYSLVNCDFVRFRSFDSGTPQEFGQELQRKGHIDDRVNISHRGLKVIPNEGIWTRKRFEIRQEMVFCATQRLVDYLNVQEPDTEGDFVRVDYCGTTYSTDSLLDRLVMRLGPKSEKRKASAEFWFTRFHEMDAEGETKSVMVLTTPIAQKIPPDSRTELIDPLLYATEEMLTDGSVLRKGYHGVVEPYRRKLGPVVISLGSDIPGTVKVHICGPGLFSGTPLPWYIGLYGLFEHILNPPRRPEILQEDIARMRG